MKVHPARAPLGAISANKARAEYLAPELVECATAQCDAATQPSKRLERVVRLPCSKCDAILPEFTASWDLNTCGVAVRVVTCGKCGGRQKIKIRPMIGEQQTKDGEEDAVLQRVDGHKTGYKTSGVSSLDWVAADPSQKLRV